MTRERTTVLTLVRHGSTPWNAQRRFQGHSDVELSEEGRAQAARVADALAGASIDAVYSSDLQRAVETARTLAVRHALEVRTDARLREFAFGAWEGLTWAEILEREPHLEEAAWGDVGSYRPTGGERFEDVRSRVRAFFDETVARHAGEHVVVVAHAGTVHAALAEMRLSEPGQIVRAASISRITMEDGRAWLMSFSDVQHLDPTR